MDLRMAVHLPRDLDKLNTLRHVLDGALDTLGVAARCRADIGLIVSETWTNAVFHVGVGAQYQVIVDVEDDDFTVTVAGPADRSDRAGANVLAESGRGAQIVSELADSMQGEPGGLLRRATKKLTWADASAASGEASSDAARSPT